MTPEQVSQLREGVWVRRTDLPRRGVITKVERDGTWVKVLIQWTINNGYVSRYSTRSPFDVTCMECWELEIGGTPR